ncbi:MAG: SGNH/GDSL hydrolase family protein [Candidatus Coatesbacteria bacterium]
MTCWLPLLAGLLSATVAAAAPAASASVAADASAPDALIQLRDAETVVFYGDSITEQNRYASLIETFLVSRCPTKNLVFHNYGWSGDTARGGNARWDRDAAFVKPTLVFVDFGMNDGAYTEFGDWILDAYLPPQRALADRIRTGGAREIMLTNSCIDWHEDAGWYEKYNETLERVANATLALGRELGSPAVDIFHPMLEVQGRFKAKRPSGTFTPDSIHPNAMGGLVMAWAVLKRLDVPRVVADVTVPGRTGATEFELAPPSLPCYVPKEARGALEFVPFEDELNRFRLTVPGWPAAAPCHLAVNGRPVAKLTAAEMAGGLDLALLDDAPWSRRGRDLFELAGYRHDVHMEAWRSSGLGAPAAAKDLPGFDAARRAREDFVAQLAGRMRDLAKPALYRIRLSTTPVFGMAKGQLRLIEGWEDPDGDHGFAWDESVVAGTTTADHTEGATAATLTFDLALYQWPGLYFNFPYPQDFGKATTVAIDFLAPAGSKLAVTLDVGAGDKKKEKKAAAGPRPVPAGKWTTVTFKLKDPDRALAAAKGWSLGFSGTPTGRTTVLIDNVRLIR